MNGLSNADQHAAKKFLVLFAEFPFIRVTGGARLRSGLVPRCGIYLIQQPLQLVSYFVIVFHRCIEMLTVRAAPSQKPHVPVLIYREYVRRAKKDLQDFIGHRAAE